MASSEAVLVGHIIEAVSKRYPSAWIFKVVGSPYQMTGVPDLLFCIEGRFIGTEVKNPRAGESREAALSRTTPTQRVQIRRINAAGGTAGTVVSVPEALAMIERALQKEK